MHACRCVCSHVFAPFIAKIGLNGEADVARALLNSAKVDDSRPDGNRVTPLWIAGTAHGVVYGVGYRGG